MKNHRIYLLLLSTVCMNPCSYSSNLSGCSALMTPPPTISLPLQNNKANILNNINLPQKRKLETREEDNVSLESSSKKTKKDNSSLEREKYQSTQLNSELGDKFKEYLKFLKKFQPDKLNSNLDSFAKPFKDFFTTCFDRLLTYELPTYEQSDLSKESISLQTIDENFKTLLNDKATRFALCGYICNRVYSFPYNITTFLTSSLGIVNQKGENCQSMNLINKYVKDLEIINLDSELASAIGKLNLIKGSELCKLYESNPELKKLYESSREKITKKKVLEKKVPEEEQKVAQERLKSIFEENEDIVNILFPDEILEYAKNLIKKKIIKYHISLSMCQQAGCSPDTIELLLQICSDLKLSYFQPFIRNTYLKNVFTSCKLDKLYTTPLIQKAAAELLSCNQDALKNQLNILEYLKNDIDKLLQENNTDIKKQLKILKEDFLKKKSDTLQILANKPLSNPLFPPDESQKLTPSECMKDERLNKILEELKEVLEKKLKFEPPQSEASKEPALKLTQSKASKEPALKLTQSKASKKRKLNSIQIETLKILGLDPTQRGASKEPALELTQSEILELKKALKLKLDSIQKTPYSDKCQVFIDFIYKLLGSPEKLKELKNAIKKEPTLFKTFKEKKELNINKLCNYILYNIYGLSYRAIAFLSKLSELLLESDYLTTQCHLSVLNSLKSLKIAEEKQKTFIEILNTTINADAPRAEHNEATQSATTNYIDAITYFKTLSEVLNTLDNKKVFETSSRRRTSESGSSNP